MSEAMLCQTEVSAVQARPTEYALYTPGDLINILASKNDVATYNRLQQYQNVEEEQPQFVNMRDVQYQSDSQIYMGLDAYDVYDAPKSPEVHAVDPRVFTNTFNEPQEIHIENSPHVPANSSSEPQEVHTEDSPDVPADTSNKHLVNLGRAIMELDVAKDKGTGKKNDSLFQANSSYKPRLNFKAIRFAVARRSRPRPYPSFPRPLPHSEDSCPLPSSGHEPLPTPDWQSTPYISPPQSPPRPVSLLPSGWQPTPGEGVPLFILRRELGEPPQKDEFDRSYRKFSKDFLQKEFTFFYKCCVYFDERIEKVLDKASRKYFENRMRDDILSHVKATNELTKTGRWVKDIQQTRLKPYLLLTLAKLGYEVVKELNLDFVTKNIKVGSMVEEVHEIVDPFTLRPSKEYKHMEEFCILLTQKHASWMRKYWAPLVELYTRKTYNEIAGKADE